MITTLHIDHIRRDGGTQMRDAVREDVVLSYAERLEAGDEFPPVVVYQDGGNLWLVDGFHRIDAHYRLRSKHISNAADELRWAMVRADVRPGSLSDAIWFAIGANRSNGLRRSNSDKQMAVRAALAHPNASGLSDQAIADQAGVSKETIRKAREVTTIVTSTQPNASASKTETPKRTATAKRKGTDGKSYPVKTPASKPPKRTPEERREHDRQRMAAKRMAVSGEGQKRKCPTCNGKGWLHD